MGQVLIRESKFLAKSVLFQATYLFKASASEQGGVHLCLGNGKGLYWECFVLLPNASEQSDNQPARGDAAQMPESALQCFTIMPQLGCARTYGAGYPPHVRDFSNWVHLDSKKASVLVLG